MTRVPSQVRLIIPIAIVAIIAIKAIGWLLGSGGPAPNPVGTGAIDGITVDDLGQPVAGARLWLTNRDNSGGWSVVSDAQGRFTFAQLPAATYGLQADSVDHARTYFTALTAPLSQTPIDVGDGGRVRDVRVVLRRASGLSGTVYGPDGKPLAGHAVRVERVGGSAASGTGTELTTTDASGRFQFKELEDGDYIVSVRKPQDASFRLYYPDSFAVSNAKRVALAPGQQRGGVDLHAPELPTANILGSLEPDDASPLQPIEVELFDLDADPAVADRHGRTVRTDSNGFFLCPAVPAGRYLLVAQVTLQPASPRHYSGAATVISDGAEPKRVKLVIARGVRVEGHARRGTLPAAGVTVRLAAGDHESAKRLGSFVASALTAGDGGFSLTDVPPGRYTLMATGDDIVLTVDGGAGSGGTIHVGAVEVTGITLQTAKRSSQISGTIKDASGNVTAAGVVVAMMAGAGAALAPPPTRIRTSLASTSGRFMLERLPPGEYDLVALTALVPASLTDPKTLEQLRSAATRVVVADGEKKTIELTAK